MWEALKMNICHVGTFYSLLIYLLLPGKTVENTFFFFSDTMALDKLPKNSFIIKHKKIKFPFTVLYYDFILKCRLHALVKKYHLDTRLIYGQDHILGSSYFLRYPFYLIEDGLGNYEHVEVYRKQYEERYFLNKVLGRKKRLGLENNVKKIYLTGMKEVDARIKDKVEIINLKELWLLKTEEEKKQILDILGIDHETLRRIKNCKNVVLTQPLSEDLVLTEEEKIEIYKKILNGYLESELLIKPHPREKTDYSKIFSQATVLKSNFPFEIISILDIKIDNLITLFSSAVFCMNKSPNTNILFYGTKISPKLVERFGNVDYNNNL